MEKKSRDQFRTRLGFIVACIGSAVGMGNIWMFPYRTGAFGGAAFLIPYFIFVILLGFSGVLGEMAFGRVMRTGPTGSVTLVQHYPKTTPVIFWSLSILISLMTERQSVRFSPRVKFS